MGGLVASPECNLTPTEIVIDIAFRLCIRLREPGKSSTFLLLIKNVPKSSGCHCSRVPPCERQHTGRLSMAARIRIHEVISRKHLRAGEDVKSRDMSPLATLTLFGGEAYRYSAGPPAITELLQKQSTRSGSLTS